MDKTKENSTSAGHKDTGKIKSGQNKNKQPKYGKGRVLRDLLMENNITTRQIVAMIASSDKYHNVEIDEYRMDKLLEDKYEMLDEEFVMIIDVGRLDPIKVFNRLQEYTVQSLADGRYASRIKKKKKEDDEDE